MRAINENTDGGVDAAIDSIGDTLPMALDAVRPEGTVVTFGVLEKSSTVQIDIRRFYLRHTRLIGIHNASGSYLKEAINFMVSRDVRPFISKSIKDAQSSMS